LSIDAEYPMAFRRLENFDLLLVWIIDERKSQDASVFHYLGLKKEY
jgi:hypothetical protein